MHENETRQKNCQEKQAEFKLLQRKTTKERGALIFMLVLLNKTLKIGQTDDGPSSAVTFKAKYYSPFAITGKFDFLFMNKS